MTASNKIDALLIGAPFGLKGHAHAYCLSGQKGTLDSIDTFYNQDVPYRVRELRSHGDHYVISFEEIASVDDIKMINGKTLSISRESLPLLEEGQFYWYDLIGLKVEDLCGLSYGEVESLYDHHHDVILTTQGYHIPFLWKDTIVSVDFEKKIITTDYQILLNDEPDQD